MKFDLLMVHFVCVLFLIDYIYVNLVLLAGFFVCHFASSTEMENCVHGSQITAC